MTSYQATSVAEATSGNLVPSCRNCAYYLQKGTKCKLWSGTGPEWTRPDSRLCTAVHQREVVTFLSVTSVKIVHCMDIVVLVVYFKFNTG